MEVDPAANAGYLIAAYVATAVVLAGYAVVLWKRYVKGSRQ